MVNDIENAIGDMVDSCRKPVKVTLYNFFKINTPEVIKRKLGADMWASSFTRVNFSNGTFIDELRSTQDYYNLTMSDFTMQAYISQYTTGTTTTLNTNV